MYRLPNLATNRTRDDMKLEDGRLKTWMNQIRTDGSIVISIERLPVPVDEWRSAIRQAARRDGLRIRTGMANCGCCAWAYHVDHVATDRSPGARRSGELRTVLRCLSLTSSGLSRGPLAFGAGSAPHHPTKQRKRDLHVIAQPVDVVADTAVVGSVKIASPLGLRL